MEPVLDWALPLVPRRCPQPAPAFPLISCLLSALDNHSCSKRQEKHRGCYCFHSLSRAQHKGRLQISEATSV